MVAGAADRSTLRAPVPSVTTYSCTPNIPTTWSPGWNSGWLDSVTSTTVRVRMTSPIPTGGAYAGPSAFSQVRIAGSNEIARVRPANSPGPGFVTGTETRAQVSSVILFSGRTASWIWRFNSGDMSPP